MCAEKLKEKETRKEMAPWRPMWGLSRMERAMERMADEIFGRRFFDWNLPERMHFPEIGLREPAIEVYEDKEEVVVKAEVPGLKKENLEVNITNHMLTIRGEKKQEVEKEKKGYYYSERSYGSFSRTVELPTDVRTEKAAAHFKDGILEIRLPKTEEAKKHEVQIKVE
jgi:HSP20 family protein